MKPVTLNVTLAVQHELEQRLEEADRLRQQRVARARYEADLAEAALYASRPQESARRRCAGSEWNDDWRVLSEAQDQYEQQSQADRAMLDEQSRKQILALATNFPRLWSDPNTPTANASG